MKRPRQTEAQFQAAVIALAKALKWRVHHSRPAMMRSGKWATPIQGHAGFPDLVLARRGEIIFAELKREGGSLSVAQMEWVNELAGSGGGPMFVWTPKDWPAIEEMLR